MQSEHPLLVPPGKKKFQGNTAKFALVNYKLLINNFPDRKHNSEQWCCIFFLKNPKLISILGASKTYTLKQRAKLHQIIVSTTTKKQVTFNEM